MSAFSLAARQKIAAEGFLGVREAAKFLGISISQTNNLAKAGVLSHATIGGKRVLPVSALVRYAAEQLRVGRVA
jgi:excisionase family DNA binding protein